MLVNTFKKSINAVQLRIKFDPLKLNIVQPAGDKSVISLWIEPPSYSNTKGTLNLAGVVPGGITTEGGLVSTITFKAIAPGTTRVSILSSSQVLANDGLGTIINTDLGSGFYTILPKPPEGVTVFSETHPFQDKWYNNDNPVVSWESPPGITDFSYFLDDKPFTVPDDIPDTTGTTAGLQKVKNGINYFHIKARKNGVWGVASHFMLRIDISPPAEFKPTYDILASGSNKNHVLVFFFTTDSLSGIDHYEVGAINKKKSPDVSPLFVQAESPYQLTEENSNDVEVVVRVFDKAGNVRDESVSINNITLVSFLKNNVYLIVFIALTLVLLLTLIFHYLFGHHIISILIHAFALVKKRK